MATSQLAAWGDAVPDPRPRPELSEPFLNGQWTERDGLPGGMILDLQSSPEGFLWVGTRDGLRAFDGRRFRVPEGLEELGETTVDRALSDAGGRLWFSGGGVIRGRQPEAVGRYRKQQWSGTDLVKDGRGWVWWRTGPVVQGRSGDLEGRLPEGPDAGSPGTLLPGLWGAVPGGVYRVDDRGNLWRGTFQGWTRIPGPLAPEQRVQWCEVFEDPSGRIWMSILTRSEEPLLFHRHQGIWRVASIPGAARLRLVRCFMSTSRGETLVGADRGLLCLFSAQASDPSVFRVDLGGEPVRAIHEDILGNWWVASEGPVLRLIRRDPNRLLVPRWTDPVGGADLAGNPRVRLIEPRATFPIQSVALDARGRLWAAAGHHGMFVREGDHLVSPTWVPESLRGSMLVTAIANSPRGMVVGGGGLLMLLDADGRRVPDHDVSGLVGSGSVVSVAVDRSGAIWVGTDSGRLIHLPTDPAQASVFDLGGGVSDMAVQGDRLWVIAGENLKCRSPEGWLAPPGDLEPLGRPRSLFVDGRDRLMVVGESAVAFSRGGRTVILGADQGVFPRANSMGFEDHRSGLWLTSETGLMEWDSAWLESALSAPKGKDAPPPSPEPVGRVIPFSILSEIQPTTHRAGMPIALPSGEIALPSNKGVLLVGLGAPGAGDAWGRRPEKPRLHIESMAMGTPRGGVGAVVLTNLCIPAEAELQVSLGGNLSANLQPTQVRCSTSRGEDSWRYWNHDGPVRIQHKGRGSFPLRFQCKQPTGAWIDMEPVWIEVDPSQGLSGVSRLGLLGMFVLMTGLLAWQVYRSARHQRQVRIRALEGVQTDRVRIARTLHDDLGNRLSEIQLLTEQATFIIDSKDPIIPLVDRIHARSIEATVALDNMVWLMRDVSESATEFAKHLEGLARDYLQVCSAELEFKVLAGPDLEVGGWVRQLIIAATQELTRNAVRHGKATRVSIELRVGSDWISYRVEDNGEGFLVDKALSSGRGLAGLVGRVKDFGGKVSVVSQPGGSVILMKLARAPRPNP